MCGRFALNAKTDEIVREFVADGGDFLHSLHPVPKDVR